MRVRTREPMDVCVCVCVRTRTGVGASLHPSPSRKVSRLSHAHKDSSLRQPSHPRLTPRSQGFSE